MKKVYLDNAATTPIRREVIEEMTNVMTNIFGNPSSTHYMGRQAKTVLELSRKTIAKHLNCSAQEIIFTSGATEANNWILRSALKTLGIKRIISSKTEHHAILYTLFALQNEFDFELHFVNIKPNGTIDQTHLASLLDKNKKTLVSLMHVNNEVGTILNLIEVAQICKEHEALFHSDTVQTVGKIKIDLKEIPVDFIVASAHKFHGPKGIGFTFIRKTNNLKPILFGGEQEKGLRAGTEGVHQIAGMAKALDFAIKNLEQETKQITNLRNYCLEQLKINFPDFKINGTDPFYNILNISLPLSEEKASMILFNLDMQGIAVSRGSACQSGSVKPSHVLKEFLSEEDLKKPNLRISFSHYNTKEDIDCFINALKIV